MLQWNSHCTLIVGTWFYYNWKSAEDGDFQAGHSELIQASACCTSN